MNRCMTMEGRKFESLECLRGFAALAVVAGHLLIGFARSNPASLKPLLRSR